MYQENVKYIQKKLEDSEIYYNGIITANEKEHMQTRGYLSEKEKEINRLCSVIAEKNTPNRNGDFFCILNNYNSKLAKDKTSQSQKIIQNNYLNSSPDTSKMAVNNSKAYLTDKDFTRIKLTSQPYYSDTVKNPTDLGLDEFNLYKKVIDDSKLNFLDKTDKINKINSIKNISNKKEIQLKKDELMISKFKINIHDKNGAIDNLKKANSSMYCELTKIREKEILEEKD